MPDELVHGIDPRPVPKIRAVQALDHGALHVEWSTGSSDRIDLSGWIALHDLGRDLGPAAFSAPTVAEHGFIVRWGDRDDSSAIDSAQLEMLAEQQRLFASGTSA